MNKRERVLAAIAHREGDRVPKGEVAIEHEFAQAMVEAYPELAAQHQPPPCPSAALALEAQVRAMLNMDLWIVGDWPRPQIGTTPEGYALRRDVWGRVIVDSGASTETLAYPIADIEQAGDYCFPSVEAIPGDDLRWVVEHTDYLPGGIINSVFEDVYNLVGFEQYMMILASEPEKLRPLAQQCAAFEVAKACRFLDLGAEMILSTCNTLIRAIPPRNALAMYRAGERPFHSERISHASDRGQTGDLLDRCQ